MLTEIEKLDALGREYGFVIYAVHQANAGWGCQWYEPDVEEYGDNWRQRLVVYGYYPTITEMVEAEKQRLANYSAGLLKK
jgi:hypothetical protein